MKRLLLHILLALCLISPVFAAEILDFSFSQQGTTDPVKGGIGSATFTYSGTNRTYIDDAGVLQTAGANTARIAPGGLLLEPQGKNLLQESRDFDEAIWTADYATTLAQDETGVDGSANKAWTFTDSNSSSGGVGHRYEQQVISKTTSDTSTYTFSIFVKKTTSASSFPGLLMRFDGGTSDYSCIIIDTDNGTVTNRDSGTAPESTGVEDAGDYWRVWMSHDDSNADNNELAVGVYPAINTDAGATWYGTTTGSAVFDAAQLEQAAFPSSYVDNDGVALGSELVTDGTFDAVSEGSEIITAQVDRDFSGASNWANATCGTYDETGDLSLTCTTGQYAVLTNGYATTTVGNTYKVTYTASGVSGTWEWKEEAANVKQGDITSGTNSFYYNAQGAGGIIVRCSGDGSIDLDDFSIVPITFTHWTAGTAIAPQASSGSLTNKANYSGDQSTNVDLAQDVSLSANTVYEITLTATRSAGTGWVCAGSTGCSTSQGYDAITTSGDYVYYLVASGNSTLYVTGNSAFIGTIDVVSIKALGTARLTEAAAMSYTLPSNLFAESLGSELVTNGTFDANTTGWTPTDCTLASVAGGQSNNSLEITRTGGSSQYAKATVTGLTADDTYALEYYLKSGTSGDENSRVQINNGSDVFFDEFNNASTGSWVKYKYYFKAPTSTIYLYLMKLTSTAGTMLFDEVSVKQVTNSWDGMPPHGTMIVWWESGYSTADVGDASQIIAVKDGTSGLLRQNATGTLLLTRDSAAQDASVSLSPALGTLYKIAIQWGFLESNVAKFRIGADSGAGVSWGGTTDYSGAFTTGSNLNIGYTFGTGPMKINRILIRDDIVQASYINNN